MGIDTLLQQNMQNTGLAGGDRLARNAMFPQSQMDKTQYAVSNQLPTSAETIRSDYEEPTNAYTGLPAQQFAEGGLAMDQDSFDAQAYLSANPDVAASGIDPWSHYQAFGISEGRDYTPMAEKAANASARTELDKYYYNPDNNQESAADIYGLKASNPDLFYKKMADSLGNQMFSNYAGNRSGYNTELNSILEGIKAENPAAYYNAQLGLLGKQEGWQHGQNTFGNAAGQQAEVARLTPEALAAGLTPEQINTLVGGGFSEASSQNQRRIANLPSAGSFWRDNLVGTAKVAAMAMGAYGLDAAMAAAQAAQAGGYGLTASSGAGGSMGAGSSLQLAPTAMTAGTGVGGGIVAPSLAGGLGAGGYGLTASQVPNLAAGLESLGVNTSGMSASDILNYANKARQAYGLTKTAGSLFGGPEGIGGGGIGGTGGSGQGITSVAPSMFNPTATSGLGIGSTTPAYNPLFLSKLSEFKYDPPSDFAAGGMAYGGGIGNLGAYSDGGRLLKGPGDGMSDHIPATIGDKQPARLADGEFVVPADVVSHLGNGSTDAGAKHLYKMMDKIRKARTGNPKQGKQINPDKFTPKG